MNLAEHWGPLGAGSSMTPPASPTHHLRSPTVGAKPSHVHLKRLSLASGAGSLTSKVCMRAKQCSGPLDIAANIHLALEYQQNVEEEVKDAMQDSPRLINDTFSPVPHPPSTPTRTTRPLSSSSGTAFTSDSFPVPPYRASFESVSVAGPSSQVASRPQSFDGQAIRGTRHRPMNLRLDKRTDTAYDSTAPSRPWSQGLSTPQQGRTPRFKRRANDTNDATSDHGNGGPNHQPQRPIFDASHENKKEGSITEGKGLTLIDR